jgi:hypothetical protein
VKKHHAKRCEELTEGVGGTVWLMIARGDVFLYQ